VAAATAVRLDGERIFGAGAVEIKAGSSRREAVEKSAAGLDGVVSIDMGLRSRKLRQAGELRAASRADLDSRLAAVSAFMDGKTHKLSVDGGQEFENVRMDSFEVSGERSSGGGVVAGYEIVYTQLRT